MDALERDIYYYLQHRKEAGVPVHEIARRAGGRMRYRYAPGWARPVLLRMVERGILDKDDKGCYRLKPVPKEETEGKRWACPRIAQLLQRRGKEFADVITVDYEDSYYDGL